MNADSKTPMTAPTPEQMRALADSLNGIELALPEYTGSRVLAATAALRAAADQLEAVRQMHHQREWRPLDGTFIGGTYCNHCRRPWPCSTYQAVTADPAAQEDHHG